MTRFAHTASATVNTLTAVTGQILVGGYYKSINGSSADPYITGLNPTTASDDGFVHLKISGNHRYAGVDVDPTRVYNQALSDKRRLGGRPASKFSC